MRPTMSTTVARMSGDGVVEVEDKWSSDDTVRGLGRRVSNCRRKVNTCLM